MIKFTEARLLEILNAGHNKKIMVIGDLMVDRYLWGNVSRLSPEAPVPIINIEEEEVRFGGAANVANNLIGLGARPILVGVVGDDQWGRVFRQMLIEKDLSAEGLVIDKSRPTTIKTRIIGNNQHVARVDRERIFPVDKSIEEKIATFVKSAIKDVDALILQDYNKGVFTPSVIRRVIEIANAAEKIVAVDPKFDNFLEYKNVTVFKPNKKETEEALARRLTARQDIVRAGEELMKRLNPRAVLITLGEKGVALFERGEAPAFMGTRAREVADVSGAGDTVIATVTTALAAGASIKEAVTLANYAAGVVCEEVGVIPIESEKLLQSVLKNQHYFDVVE